MTFTIGEVASQSGATTKTIRYYESIGLLDKPQRAANGYRTYDAKSIETLRFVRRARSLGFSLEEVQALLALWADEHRASAEVKDLALRHVAEVEKKIAELEGLRDTLMTLIDACHGDDRPDCPILDELFHTKER